MAAEHDGTGRGEAFYIPPAQYNICPCRGWAGATAQRMAGYDFLDFGASKGGSIDFAMARLGGRKGLGIDIDPKKIQRMRESGYDCLEANVLNLDLPENSVRFVMISHFLEHLADIDEVREAVASAARTARDFIFIRGPWFDADDRLRAQGLKFYWSDWHGHPCHLTTGQLRGVLDDLGLNSYAFLGRSTVANSLDSAIHPAGSPRDQHDYVDGVHPPKPYAVFEPPLFREMVCIVALRRLRRWNRVVRVRKGCHYIEGTLSSIVDARP